MNWKTIETAPKDSRKMFVVIAKNIDFGGVRNYTSDPYCVWSEVNGFARWPHEFRPTHWCELPE